jgi:hypothetical protein
MGVFIFKADKDLAKPRHAVSKQDLHSMFIARMKAEKVKDITVDFKNGIVKGLCLNKSGDWKEKRIKFIEVVK